MDEFRTVDFNGESTFEIIQVLCFFRAFYEQLSVKFTPWVEDTLSRCWAELKCEHEDVLAYFSEILAFTGKIMVSRSSVLVDFETQRQSVAPESLSFDTRDVCPRVQNALRNGRYLGNQRHVPPRPSRGTRQAFPNMARREVAWGSRLPVDV